MAQASYFSQRKAVDQPPGFMGALPAIVSCILLYVTVTQQAAYCVSMPRQSVKDYQNHHTATLYSTVCCIKKRTKDQSERSFDTLVLLNTSSAELVEEPQKGRGSYLEGLMSITIPCTASFSTSPRISEFVIHSPLWAQTRHSSKGKHLWKKSVSHVPKNPNLNS